MGSAWSTIAILLVGVVVVVGGVLVWRLHAFLALILGALAVAVLTPSQSVVRHHLESSQHPILGIDARTGEIRLRVGSRAVLREGMLCIALRRSEETGGYEAVAELDVQEVFTIETGGGKPRREAVAKLRPDVSSSLPDEDDLVVSPEVWAEANRKAAQNIGARVAAGFGNTCTKIGILIAMASIIGKCLLDSGAADRIVRAALKLLGERGAPAAFLGSGFLLGIPVFFDTVFYLMIPLGKAMRMRTGRNYLLYVLTIVAGGTMAHSLVPPTPGPLFVAEQLGIDIGAMILAGCIVGAFTASFGYAYATVVNRIWELPVRETAEFSLSDLEAITQRDENELPPTWLSLLPIVLPVVLIAGNTVLKAYAPGLPATFWQVAGTLGDKNIALGLSAAIAMAMLVRQKRTDLRSLAESVQSSLASGGVIILITAAGGAFGSVLQQTGVSHLIRDLPHSSPVVIIVLAFLITMAIRTAQGSATVAMITAVGILAGLAGSPDLGFHPVYIALAIGCGSKPIGWMNDSGFWVVGKMSGMTEAETLKYVTPMTSLMGFVGLIVVVIGVIVFPMA